MSLTWLMPGALAGLLLLVVPIVIHLLTRQERRLVPFPSLRFLRETSMAAWRRRLVDDWRLLAIRMLAVGAAVGALAGPLVVTPVREAVWAARVSRAIVRLPSAPSVDDERRLAYASAEFVVGESLADALHAAVAWLDAQSPSGREVVIAGDLRALPGVEADLSVVPPQVGLRFRPGAEPTSSREMVVPMLAPGPSGALVTGVRVRLEDDRTIVMADAGTAGLKPRHDVRDGGGLSGGASAPPPSILEARASRDDQPVANAALAAVLQQGTVLDQARARRVIVAWEGAEVADLGGAVTPPTQDWILPALERLAYPGEQFGDALVVRAAGRARDEQAAIVLGEIARAVFADDRADLEPRRVPAADLGSWSRPVGGLAPDAVPVDEGDRRWFWALALVMMLVEQAWRRSTVSRGRAETPPAEEPRVA